MAIEVAAPLRRRPDDFDRVHICDLDEYIALLEQIRALAKQHFGEHWPDL